MEEDFSAFKIWKRYFDFHYSFGLETVQFNIASKAYDYNFSGKGKSTRRDGKSVARIFFKVVIYVTLACYALFCGIRMARCFYHENTDILTKAACWAWILFAATGTCPLSVFVLESKQINRFMEAWAAFDSKIIEGQRTDPRQTPNVCVYDLWRAEIHGIRFTIMIVATTLVFDLITIALNAYGVPSHPFYLSSLLQQENRHTWIMIPLILFQVLVVLVVDILRYQLLAFVHGVARSLTYYLKCITPHVIPDIYKVADGVSPPWIRKSEVDIRYTEKYIDMFMEIRDLIEKFNRAFGWCLAVHKFFLIVLTTFLIFFVLMEKRPGTPMYSFSVFFWGAGSQLTRTFVTGVIWERLYAASAKFAPSWREQIAFGQREIGEIEESLLQRLKSCKPFGICIGGMYMVRPRTVLTHCSVIMSYLIVALQMKKPRLEIK